MFSWFQSIWQTIELIHNTLWTGIRSIFILIPRAVTTTAACIDFLPTPLIIFAVLALYIGLQFLILKLVAMLL